jgi:dihydrofolate synthase / folylpolyglutamate synthase
MKITTYKEAEEYLDTFISNTVFERIEKATGLPDPLDRMRQLLSILGDPHTKYPSIQVSGTSGKTSTAYMISRMLHEAGYKVGLTISPHLQQITERIQLGTPENRVGLHFIPESDFVRVLNKVIPAIDEMKKLPLGVPSYFEILLAMAFVYFAEQQIDLLVAEVGLEGSYDGTNVLTPYVAVLTNISLDHTAILGNTVEEIASEAVIIIKNLPSGRQIVISGVEQQSVQNIIMKRCKAENAELLQLGHNFHYAIDEKKKRTKLAVHVNGETISTFVSSPGSYQAGNAAIATVATLSLRNFSFTIDDAAVRRGLESLVIPGRFEEVSYKAFGKTYTVLLDGAHNVAKMQAFIATLKKNYPQEKIIFILAFKNDKDITSMLSLLTPHASVYILTEFTGKQEQSKNAALPTHRIATALQAVNTTNTIQIYETENVEEAIRKALSLMEGNTIIVITGSLYLVGEAREQLI